MLKTFTGQYIMLQVAGLVNFMLNLQMVLVYSQNEISYNANWMEKSL